MKYYQIAAVAAFAGLANAQSQCLSLVTGIPACALGIVAEIAYSSYSCDIVDFACQCSNINNLYGPVAASLNSQGSACNLVSVLSGANSLCTCATSYAPSSVTLASYEKACEPLAATIPACALGYLASAGAVQGCQVNDFGCLCSNFNNIQGAIADPVQSACSYYSVGLTDVLSSANALCSCVTASSPSGSSPSATTTTPGSSPTVSASPSGSSSSGVSSTGSPTGTVAPTGTGSTTGTVSVPMQTGTASITFFTNAGATATAFGGIFGLVAGLAAFL